MTLEAIRAQFAELVEKFEHVVMRGNKLNRQLAQVRTEAQELAGEIQALLKKLSEEHSGDPDALGTLSDMAAQMAAVFARNPCLVSNPSLPIQ